MTLKPDVLINSIFIKNRLIELGIKQWWLAEQIGVDRKTVARWLSGKVKSIKYENALTLSKILNSTIDEISIHNEAEQYATSEDQKNAATQLINSSLVDKLGPLGEWNVIESLLKSTLVPNLPINTLVELYNQLTIASWRQSKTSQAKLYNDKTFELINKSKVENQDKSQLAKAYLSRGNLLSWSGKTESSINSYLKVIELEKYLKPQLIGSAYSNLGAVYYESGDLTSGEIYLKKALEYFLFNGTATNKSIANCSLAMLNLQKNDLIQAENYCDVSIQMGKVDEYLRGIAMGTLIQSEICARQNNAAESLKLLNEALEKFSSLKIEEGLNYEFAGRICRLNGSLMESKKYLKHGVEISADFPLYQAFLYFELALTLKLLTQNWQDSMNKAKILFIRCEAPIRANSCECPPMSLT